jgi:hypothetical protein
MNQWGFDSSTRFRLIATSVTRNTWPSWLIRRDYHSGRRGTYLAAYAGASTTNARRPSVQSNRLPSKSECSGATAFPYAKHVSGSALSIKGTGESVGEGTTANGDTASSLKFASADPKSFSHFYCCGGRCLAKADVPGNTAW